MFFRPVPILLGLWLSTLGPSAYATSSERPEIADEVERRYDGEFMFTTNGDGHYELYQRLEVALVTPHEVTCLVRSSCYVEIAVVSEDDLRRAEGDGSVSRGLGDLLLEARSNQRRVGTASAHERAGLEAAWFTRAASIASCLAMRRC